MDSLQRFSRKCCQSGRDLLPGDQYVSVLLDTVEGIQREDYAVENWPGEPEDAICYWHAQIPLPAQVKMRWAPDHVLRAYCQAVFKREDWVTLNMLAMALVRRRMMNLDYGTRSEGSEDGLRQLTLTDRKTADSYTFPEVDLSQVDLNALETELQDHLFTDQVELEEPDDLEPADEEE